MFACSVARALLMLAIFTVALSLFIVQMQVCLSPATLISTCENVGVGTSFSCEQTVFGISEQWCPEHAENFAHLLPDEDEAVRDESSHEEAESEEPSEGHSEL